MFPLLQSQVAACFTLLHLTFGIVLVAMRLASSCVFMETHVPKSSQCTVFMVILMPVEVQISLAMDSFSRLFGDFCSLYASSLWFHAVFCFMAELLLFPNAYTFRQHHLQLIVLSSRVEISWTDCCKSGILSRYHTWIQWALQNDPFFSQRFLNADCMAKCMILYTFGNGSDWNTWIQ